MKHHHFETSRFLLAWVGIILSALWITPSAIAQLSQFEVVNLKVPNASRYDMIHFVDINNRNQVVGYAKEAERNGVMLLYLPEPAYGLTSGMNVIQIPGENPVPNCINDNGVIGGYLGEFVNSQAFTWSEGATSKFRFTNHPDDRSKLMAITNNGYMTGTAYVGDYRRGFVRRPDQLVISDPADQIAAVNGGQLTMVDINTSGQAIGNLWLSEAVFVHLSAVWERPITFGGHYDLILTSAIGLQQMEQLLGAQSMKVVVAWLHPIPGSPPGSEPKLHVRVYGPHGGIVFDKAEAQLPAGQELDQLKALISQVPTPQASNFTAAGQHAVTTAALSVANFRPDIGTEVSLITPAPYESIVGESADDINDFGQIVGATPTQDGALVFLHLPVPDYGLPAGVFTLNEVGFSGGAGGVHLNNNGQIVTAKTYWSRGAAFDLESLLPSSEDREVFGAHGLNDFGNVVAQFYNNVPGDQDEWAGRTDWVILDTGEREGKFSITLEPDQPSYKVGDTIVLRTKLRHAEPGALTYAFPGGPFSLDPDFFEYRAREGAGDPPNPAEPLFDPVEPFVLTPEDRNWEYATPIVAKKRGVTFVASQVKVTNALDEIETFSVVLPVVIDPLETEITITKKEHLLNQTPESEWGSRAKALNNQRRAAGEEPYSNLIEIELKLKNASEIDIKNITVSGATDIHSLITSTDLQKLGVPLSPIRFYSHDGSTIDLTDLSADRTIVDLTLAGGKKATEGQEAIPGEEATFAWVVDAYDANPDPELDDSADLKFKALVLSNVGGKTIRTLDYDEFHVIDRPLLEWGIRPKDGRINYISGQAVRVEGYIENISTKDDRPPQDIRVMVYQMPSGNVGGRTEKEVNRHGGMEGNLGGGFMFDAANTGSSTPKYYEIFDLPAEGEGKSKNLAAILRSFPTVEPSGGKVHYGVRMWTVVPDPEAPLGEVVEEASQQVKLKEEWRENFDVNFSANRPAFTSQEECYALGNDIPELAGIWPFLCGLEEGLTKDFTDGIIGLGQFMFKSGKQTLDAGVGIAVWEFRTMSKVWRAVQADPAAQKALLQEAYVQYETFVNLGVMAGEAGSKTPMALAKFSEHAVAAMADFFFAIEKGDIKQMEFAVGKFLGANPDIILEPLVVARNYQRMSKAMLKLEEELVDNSIRASVKAEKARQATSLDQRLRDAVAVGKAPETALLPGDILSDSKLLDIFGVTRDQRKAIQKIADDNGVVITFRSRNPVSVKLLREGKAYPKPQALKHKTVNKIDIEYLGYRKDAFGTLEMVEPPAGLLDVNGRALTGDALETALDVELMRLGDKIGNNQLLKKEIRGRMEGRAEEWNKLFYDKLDSTKPGTIEQKITTAFEAELQNTPKDRDLVKQVGAIDPRVVSYEPVPGRNPRTWEMKMTGPVKGGVPGPPRSITGDVDFLAVLDEAGGLIRDIDKRNQIYAQLETMLDMQHGESYTFFLQNARLEHLRCCALGAEGAEAMVAISGLGDGTPRAAYFVDNMSIIDGGKNAAYLPARQKIYKNITDFILRPGEIKTVRRIDPSGEFMFLDGIHIFTKPSLDLVNRFIPDTFAERLTKFLSSPSYIGPALLLRLFDAEERGATFTETIDGKVIRAIDAGEQFILQIWNKEPIGIRSAALFGWHDITIEEALAFGNPNVLELAPMTIMPEGGDIGQRRVEIAPQELFETAGDFFDVGDEVVINPGGLNEEFQTVQGLGSLIFANGLVFDHLAGELIVSLGPDMTDRDGDNLTGFEEIALGTNPDLADTDSDGLRDDVEIANGFDPRDPLSGLRVDRFQMEAGGSLTIEWSGQVGMTYAIDASQTLLEEDWQEVARVIAAPGVEQVLTVENPFSEQEHGFFRVRLLTTEF